MDNLVLAIVGLGCFASSQIVGRANKQEARAEGNKFKELLWSADECADITLGSVCIGVALWNVAQKYINKK